MPESRTREPGTQQATGQAPRTALRRYPVRALPEGEELAILQAGLVAHAGFVQDGWPYVIPMTYLYQDGVLYLHGAHGSRAIKTLASGGPVCVEVTLVDALIASKSAESHSVNYRSVLCFGRGALVREEPVRLTVLNALIARYFPGRQAGVEYQPITAAESKATALVAVTVEAVSAKGRSGGPSGPFDDDPAVPGQAGVVPVSAPS